MAKVVLLTAAKRLSAEFGYSKLQLREAIPYIREFQDKTMVVKVGGSILDDDADSRPFLEDIVFMKQIGISVVLVHGGSRDLSNRMAEEGIKPRMMDGERYTDRRTLELAVEVFNKINRQLVTSIKDLGGQALGFPAGGQALIQAERKGDDQGNFVGRVTRVDVERLQSLKPEYIPIATCIGTGASRQLYNINADEVASKIACALRAEKLILLTNVDGVVDAEGQLISTLTHRRTKQLLKAGIIQSGMRPKVRVCLEALQSGVQKTHIINGVKPGSILCEVLTDSGVGTEIVMTKRRVAKKHA